jgi:hypothetical protein
LNKEDADELKGLITKLVNDLAFVAPEIRDQRLTASLYMLAQRAYDLGADASTYDDIGEKTL